MTFRRIFTQIKSNKARQGFSKFWQTAFSPKFLFYTNVIVSMGISTAGDFLEQSYERAMGEIQQYDFNRTAHMSFSGSTAGIITHNWYKILDKVIIGRTFDMVIKKVLLDQFICSPIIILSFFATVAIFEDDPWANFTEEVSDKFLTLYKAEWLVWPPAQIINFYFMPLKYRVVYDNTISLGYDVYTSHVKHDTSNREPKKEEKVLEENKTETASDNDKTKNDDDKTISDSDI